MRRIAILLALALSGCFAADAVEAPREVAAFLGSRFVLLAQAEENESVVRAGSFFRSWADGDDYPTWRGEPEPRDVLVDNVSASVRLRVSGPVARTMRFPDLMVYAGSGDAWMGYGNATTPLVLAPGQTYAFDVAVAVPAGGLWVPAGERFGLKLVPVMHQNEFSDVEIVLGGEDGSRASWTQRVTETPTGATTRERIAGETTGSAYAGAAAPESTSHATRIQLDSPNVALLAWMNTTEARGIPDLDLALLGPGGRQVAGAGTPTPREALRLHGANLREPGEHQLVVTSYGSAQAAFTLEWLVVEASG